MAPDIEFTALPSVAVGPTCRPSFRLDSPKTANEGDTWAAFLWGLCGAGQIRIGTSLPAVTLEHYGHWPGARIKGAFGIASGRRFTIEMVLERWSHIEPSAIAQANQGRLSRLSILDRHNTSVLDLGFDEDRLSVDFSTLTRGLVAGHHASSAEALTSHSRNAGQFNREALRDHRTESGDSVDLAEATGQLRLSPARLRERGQANAVDTELVPCFLEALAEQAMPIRLATGTPGVAHSIDTIFFCHRREGSWQTLQGDRARFQIDTSRIDSAWVVKAQGAAPEQASLRLYDATGRLLATVGSSPGHIATENPIWRTLVNALLD